ncbi:MAG: hypothetical protein WEB57_10600 [Pseudohongiellaceae bacterium]
MNDDSQHRISLLEKRIEELEAELDGVIEERDYWQNEAGELGNLFDAQGRFYDEMGRIQDEVLEIERREGSRLKLFTSALTGICYGLTAVVLGYLLIWGLGPGGAI